MPRCLPPWQGSVCADAFLRNESVCDSLCPFYNELMPTDMTIRPLLAIPLLLAAFLALGGNVASANPEEGYRMKTIRLPQPIPDSHFSLERALKQRRSVRNFSGAAITLNEIAQLLWSAQGITSPDGLRTAPSAGALYPLEITLAAGNVTGLDPGVYRYDPSGHVLTPVSDGDHRAELARAALDQQWMRTAAAVIAFGAVEERTTRKYGNRGISYVYIEVGHSAQNVFLQAQALGLGAAAVGAFDDARIASILQMPKEERPLYLMPVGKPLPP